MKANATGMQPLIKDIKQFVVPLFQRPYSWEKKHWKTLWDDVCELYEDGKPKTHFLGSIVTSQTQTAPEGMPKFLLIDGQQRMTTLFILLCALRDHAKKQAETADNKLAEQIQNLFLINQHKNGIEALKLLPTQIDRPAFIAIVKGELSFEKDSLITQAYQFFMSQLNTLKNPDIERLKRILVNNLYMVSIVLEHDDNPYLIFESLNAKGRPLTQGDLVRNYFLMRIHANQQESVFNDLWRPMEDRLGDKLTTFFRHFLLRDYIALTENEVYLTLKNICDGQSEEGVIEYLHRLNRFSQYYEQLIRPEVCQIVKIRSKLENLKLLDVSTCFPFLLSVFEQFAAGNLREDEVIETLVVIENFVIRRDICGVATNTLNKIFASLFNQIEMIAGENFCEQLKVMLASKNYPHDKEFQRRLMSLSLYGSGERRRKTKFILMCLERSLGDKEKLDFDNLTIEHIMPQTLTDEWKQQMGENWAKDHAANLHTLGNLTLTGYNSELSNIDFSAKKRRFAESRLRLNDYFADCNHWNAEEIKRRAEAMVLRALDIWPSLSGVGSVSTAALTDVTGTRPVQVAILGQSIQVSKWSEVIQVTLEALFSFKPDMVDKAISAFTRYLSRQEESLRRAHRLSNGVYMEKNLSANFCYRFCQKIVTFFGIPLHEYVVETER